MSTALWTDNLCNFYLCQVAQIRIRNKEFPFHVIYMAVGAELDLPLSYFDALGRYMSFVIKKYRWVSWQFIALSMSPYNFYYDSQF